MSQRGVLLYVVTDAEADPPRMLDAPMADAEARGLPTVAVLVGPNGIVGAGVSREALDVLVDHFAAWSRDPDIVEAPQPPAIAPAPS